MSTKSEHAAVIKDEKEATKRHAAKEAPKKDVESRVAALERMISILAKSHSVSTGTKM